MEQPWDMRLVVDARDLDTVRVRPRRFGGGPQVHLTVRTGPLTVFCLDGAAVRTIASAWAQAQASSAHLLPAQTPEARPLAQPPKGAAWAVGDVVAEGPQRWDVTAPHPGQPFTTVTTDWLTVRVHDRAALQTYTHAWAGACALGIRIMPNPPAAFDLLLRQAYDRDFMIRHRREHPTEGLQRGR
jgi:hypothetical protein